jgi:ABC-type Fe3+-hydroxamate transport system substrate-binding protein
VLCSGAPSPSGEGQGEEEEAGSHLSLPMPFFTDQLNRTIEIPSSPKRVISLVPSQTEFLFDLGLEEEVIGITKFCIHPEKWFRQKVRIGGTKMVNLEKVIALQPDLIIANKEENVQEQVEELARHFPVWVSDVNNLEEAFQMMISIGEITNRKDSAEKIVMDIRTSFTQRLTPNAKRQTAYLIWKDPYMTIGGDTFIHEMLESAGFQNMFADRRRYPVVTIEEVKAGNCEIILLSSEPYPFKQKHVEELQALLPETRILLVDGELFSWYGSRLLHSAAYFQQLQQQLAFLH